MTERGSVTELFAADELIAMMQFDFNAPVSGLINLKVAPPYGLNPPPSEYQTWVLEKQSHILLPTCAKCGLIEALHPTIPCHYFRAHDI